MSVRPGSRLGAYEILELLGEGGMGSVYRAHDPRLGRDVAIKIVRPVFAADPDRAARFQREARLLASLNHPHIATVYGLEEADGVTFLVLELVEGSTLAERLCNGPVPVRDALALALQVVSAIEAAHERNIIHRDLKPANIKITPAGTIKVLDFGLAKALAPDSSLAAVAQTATLTASGTGEGVIVGTGAYMSPEQARGKELDRRTDIWSFGCVLFDMLTGHRAFSGDTLSDTLAAVLTREPDWALLPPDVPSSVRRLLRHCLEKDVTRRLRDAGDARFDIEEALAPEGSSTSSASAARAAVPSVGAARWHVTRGMAVALALGALLGAAALWAMRPAEHASLRARAEFAVPLPADDRLTDLDFGMLAIASDDTHLVYVAGRRGRPLLFVRPLSSVQAEPLEGTEGAVNPFFSPDGRWIAFFADGKLRKVPVEGGPVREIADAEIGFGGAWARDGTIVFAPSNASPLVRVSADGGTPQPVTRLDTARGEFSHRWPELLPDGKTVVFAVGTVGNWDDAEIVAQALDGGKPRLVVQGGTSPRYSATGHLLYAHDGAVRALRYDPRASEVVGTSTPIIGGVLQSVDGAAQFAVSRAGSLVYVPGGNSQGRTLVWVDREGNVQPLPAAPARYAMPRLSPDNRTLAVTIEGSPEQIWTYSIPENKFSQVTSDGGGTPVWSRDGQRLFFSAARDGPPALFVTAADGTGSGQRLARSTRAQVPQSVSAADNSLLFVEFDPASGRDIMRLDADGRSQALLATAANERAPAVSPDGRWFAYVSDAAGQTQVFVSAIDDPSRRVPVSSGEGSEPVWRPDGTEIFFRQGTSMMAAAVKTRPPLAVGPVRQLFEGTFETGSGGSPAYDVSRDGMRFLMVKPVASDNAPRELRVILGWSSTLTQ